MILYIDPRYIPDGLLLRMHQSLHGIMLGIVRGERRRGVTRYLRYGGFVAWTHGWTALEMRSRGHDHRTPIATLLAQVPPDRRRLDYPLRPEYAVRDRETILRHQRVGAHASMFRSTMPARLAGQEFLDAHRRVLAEGRVPPAYLAV